MEIIIQDANIRISVNAYGGLRISRLDNDTLIQIAESGDGLSVTGRYLSFERDCTPAGWDCLVFRQRALSEPCFEPSQSDPFADGVLYQLG
jgi:hypothetical protein